ncbi:type IV toxin-antitoxin system AbiEi family antitoxin domain-containing protein [Baekduia sp. Peel2402]|uniref:type IV toxin-antitoxin system AbiEi family antitoxin domain-containing protein n=1 Tax=Baekduia sp. Peel2402 TaxID=3458296 RepID=UPI00403EE362
MEPSRDLDRRIAALAGRQHGPVTRQQLYELGLTPQQIAYRIDAGRLIRLYRAVYAVGHPCLSREGRWMAAVLTCGPGAMLSHGDAAALWDLRPAHGAAIHVTTSARAGRVPDRRRVRLHRVGTLTGEESMELDGIPVTTPARTLLDLAPSLRPRTLEEVIERMDRLALFDLVAVRRVLDAHPRQSGAPKLRGVLDRLAGTGVQDTRSPLEVALLQLCDDHRLPTPAANILVAGHLVDFHWPGTDLVVETDGFAFHRTRSAFDADRERDQALVLAGYRVVRFTYEQVTRRRRETANRLRRLLAGSGSRNN